MISSQDMRASAERRSSKFPALLLPVALLLGGCATLSEITPSLSSIIPGSNTVSETGRSQLLLVGDAQANQEGARQFEQVKRSTPISKDAKLNKLVRTVGERIAAVAPLENAQWEFVVFDQAKVNAFCLPGGKIGVYTGILPVVKDETGLAFVLGHEVAHAVARHSAERYSQDQLVGKAVGLLSKGKSAKTAQRINKAAELGVRLPFSRSHELEADRLGLLYMARAGYDPRKAPGFFQRMQALMARSGQGTGISFLQTHPVSKERITALRKYMPEALQEYKRVIADRGNAKQ